MIVNSVIPDGNIIGKSVYDFMMMIEKMDCDIVSDNCDLTYPSLVEFGCNNLTKEGHKVWDDVLKKYIIKKITVNNGYYTLYATNPNDEEDEGEDLNKFEYMLAGYVESSKYDKWVNP